MIKSVRYRRDDRVVDGACLENRCGETHRGFESLSLRHNVPLKQGEVPEWLIGAAC